MFLLILSIIFSTTATSQNFSNEHLEKLKRKQDISFSDLLHENKNCLENSICSKQNGKKLGLWKRLNQTSSYKKVEKFRKKNGLPIQFLVKSTHAKQLDPILFSSRCKNHNLKNQDKIYKAIMFLRNNPKNKNIALSSVYNHVTKKSYEVPYGDQPILLWKNKIYFVKDFEGLFFNMSIDDKGRWRVANIPQDLINKALRERQKSTCEKVLKSNSYYQGSYCNKIWNADSKSLNTIEQSWSCP